MGLFSFLGGLLGLGGVPSQRIQVSKASAAAGLPIIYGRRRVTPIKVFKTVSRSNAPEGTYAYDHSFITQIGSKYEETRDNYDFLHRVDVWGQGEISAIEKFWLDGDAATAARFKKRPYFRALSNYGSDTQTAMTALSAASSRWTANHKGSGVAYTWSRFYNSSKKPQFTAEPELKAQIKGIRVYDPRQDINQPNGAGSQLLADESTWTYSENRALLVLDYLMASYGFAAAQEEIDFESFMTAADQCDQAMTIPPRQANDSGSPINGWWDRELGEFITIGQGQYYPTFRPRQVGITQPRWHGAAVLNPKDGVVKNLEQLLEGFGWALSWSNGRHRLVLEDTTTTAIATFDKSSIIGDWTSRRGNREGRLNRITIEFQNENKNFEDDTVSWPEKGSQTHTGFVNEDGGQALHTTKQVKTITDFYRAQAYAEYLVRKSRVAYQIQGMRLAPHAMLLEPGDVIDLDYAEKGFSGDAGRFIVEKVQISPTLEVEVDLLKYEDSVYNPDARTEEPLDNSMDTADLWLDPPAITGLAHVETHDAKSDGSVITGLEMSWQAPDATVGIDRIEISWREHSGPVPVEHNHDGGDLLDHSGDADYTNQAYLARDVTSYRISGLADDKSYDVRLVYWTQRGQQSDELVDTIYINPTVSKLSDIDDEATSNRHRGDFQLTTGYKKGDVVEYMGFSYWMKWDYDISGIVPTNTTYWTKLASVTAGIEVLRASTAPATADLPEGSFWFDTVNVKLYVLTAGVWEEAASSNTVIYNNTAPSSGKVGDLWYDTNDNILYGFNGVIWEAVGNMLTNTSQLVDDAGLGTTAVWNSVSGRMSVALAINEHSNGNPNNDRIRFFGVDSATGLYPDRTQKAVFYKDNGVKFEFGGTTNLGESTCFAGIAANGYHMLVLDASGGNRFVHTQAADTHVGVVRRPFPNASEFEYYRANLGWFKAPKDGNYFIIGWVNRQRRKFVSAGIYPEPVPLDAIDSLAIPGELKGGGDLPTQVQAGVIAIEPSQPLRGEWNSGSPRIKVLSFTIHQDETHSVSYGTTYIPKAGGSSWHVYLVDPFLNSIDAEVSYITKSNRTSIPENAIYLGYVTLPNSSGTNYGYTGGAGGGGGTYDPNYQIP